MRAIALLVSAVAVAGCNPFEPKLNTVCEELVKERLRSPSAYERVRLTALDEIVSAEAYEAGYGYILTTSQRAVIEGGANPHRHTVIVEYDAPNAYGTPVRSAARCVHYSIDGKSENANRYSTSVE